MNLLPDSKQIPPDLVIYEYHKINLCSFSFRKQFLGEIRPLEEEEEENLEEESEIGISSEICCAFENLFAE